MSREIIVNVCMDTGGIASGSLEVMQAFEDEFKRMGLTASVEKHCKLHRVGCFGFCARDVLVNVTVDGVCTTYQYIKPDMVERLVKEHILEDNPVSEWQVDEEYEEFYRLQKRVVLANNSKIDPENIQEYIDIGGYGAIKKILKGMSSTEVIECVKASGLRGRGGAGFPTGLKCEICARHKEPVRYLICNADEGDPGAFMDRSVIEGNPHSLIEGMSIGAYAIGAHTGYVYIRAEYPLAVERLNIALQQARDKGFLGNGIHGSGFDFEIKVKLGAGAFVCGEETALIASIEGERGMPRAKPPYPADKGLWGKPTIINNVETWANLPPIINNGAEWYASIGSENSKGTKVFALTGKIKNTGLIEVPMGISLRDIIFEIGGGIAGGRLMKAVQTGGPSGGCIPQAHIDMNVDYDNLVKVGSMMGSGGMVVLDETDCMVNISRYFLEFTQAESCGKCTPCRIGTKRLLEILTRITAGEGKKGDIDLLLDLASDVKETSLCGLGMSAPNPVLSTIKYFRHEYEAHIHDKRCPAKVCRKLLTFFIREDLCTGCGVCLKSCPAGAVSGTKKNPHRIDTSVCIKCGACYDVCKFKAVLKE
ncbi:MAG: NADH-quinone oxidoreductase subunit NuoF [Deltaproteobacteria bacterium]|jgi:NADH-quinone oxidoreductase subunit F|nr:NADH-quinone oxidoreductase subunit NuoF [Deltaproteobacteria bacterium]